MSIPIDDSNEETNIGNPPRGDEKEPGAKQPRKRTTPGVEVAIEGKSFAEIISLSLEKLADHLTVMQVKPTLSEYIKLCELAKEFRIEPDRKEVQYKWIEPNEPWSSVE